MLGEIKHRCRSRLVCGQGCLDTSVEFTRRNQKSRTGKDLQHKAQKVNQLSKVNDLAIEKQ